MGVEESTYKWWRQKNEKKYSDEEVHEHLEEAFRGCFTVNQAWRLVQEKGGMGATRTYWIEGDGWTLILPITISFD